MVRHTRNVSLDAWNQLVTEEDAGGGGDQLLTEAEGEGGGGQGEGGRSTAPSLAPRFRRSSSGSSGGGGCGSGGVVDEGASDQGLSPRPSWAGVEEGELVDWVVGGEPTSTPAGQQQGGGRGHHALKGDSESVDLDIDLDPISRAPSDLDLDPDPASQGPSDGGGGGSAAATEGPAAGHEEPAGT